MKQGYNGSLTRSETTDLNGIGNLFYEDEKIYRWVKNDEASTALSLGQVCAHTLSDGIALTQKVKIPATANLGFLAGVVVSTLGIAAGSYGFIQVFGPNTSVSVSGATTGGTAIAAGDYLKGVNAAAHVVRDAAVQPQYMRGIQAITLLAVTTTPAAAYLPCFIRCFQ